MAKLRSHLEDLCIGCLLGITVVLATAMLAGMNGADLRKSAAPVIALAGFAR
ncbi:MAG TPA: hypothetical protein VGD36_10970 [Xanthobacteraceae bacterium]|jgi:hypothetical protein